MYPTTIFLCWISGIKGKRGKENHNAGIGAYINPEAA
jgi:hypothetical protein